MDGIYIFGSRLWGLLYDIWSADWPRELPFFDELVYLSVFLSLGLMFLSMWRVLKRDSVYESALLMMFPFFAYLIADIYQLFAMNGVMQVPEFMEESGAAAALVSDPRLRWEILALCLLLFALTVIYALCAERTATVRDRKRTLVTVALACPLELLMALFLLTLGVLSLTVDATLWPVRLFQYALYALCSIALKCGVMVMTLIYAALFGRRRPSSYEYGMDPLRLLRRYVSAVYGVWLGGALPMLLLNLWVVFWPDEDGSNMLTSLDFASVLVIAFALGFAGLTALCLWRTLFPGATRPLRRLEALGFGDARQAAERVCSEWLGGGCLWADGKCAVTRHFIIRDGFFFDIYLLHHVTSCWSEDDENGAPAYRFVFRDGRKCRVTRPAGLAAAEQLKRLRGET